MTIGTLDLVVDEQRIVVIDPHPFIGLRRFAKDVMPAFNTQ